jgi:hypothetical protein
MIPRTPFDAQVEEPLIACLELNRPISADVLRQAINYRETIIDIKRLEVEVLQKALARLIGAPERIGALQESPRRVEVPTG